jgi:hypothetical protein
MRGKGRGLVVFRRLVVKGACMNVVLYVEGDSEGDGLERMLLALNGVAALPRPTGSVSTAQLQRRPEGEGGGSMMGRPAAWGVVAVGGQRRPVLNWIKGRHPERCTCAGRWGTSKQVEAEGEKGRKGSRRERALGGSGHDAWEMEAGKDQAGGES